jgi:uncharacterized protein (TIGR03435 family)
MKWRLFLTAVVVVFGGAAARPGRSPTQAPAAAGASSAFEVASIKRNRSGSDSTGVRGQPGGRLTITNNTLRNIIRNAYSLQDFQIIGGPDWIDAERWDIVAKGEDNPQREQMSAMLQTLLADRFKLVVHRETREMPIYALVFSRGDRAFGPQFHVSTTDCRALMAAARARGAAAPPSRVGGPVSCGMFVTNGRIEMNAEVMVNLVRNLAPLAGRSIIDKTGLTGNYDMELTWTPDVRVGNAADGAPAANDGPSLFTAVQEQLGLKLDAQRGPVDVLVIDSAQRPTED